MTNPPPPYPKPPIPPGYGTVRIGGNVIWSTGRPGSDDDGRKRYTPTCPQCGGPHSASVSFCLYCLTPKADAGPVEMIEVTTLEDAEPRYLPRYAVEPFAPPRK